ncbi:MAG TPA: hypothetical protein VG406_27350 [Isosphaeraceae bacterium]|jgi:hypothetical protein|nr:hypothetical protein [Isosphaeraceae bacterium]
MKETTATSDAAPVRGFAWHVYPDPAGSGALAGDGPFNPGESRGPGRPPLEGPPGVAAFWTVHGKVPALLNQVEDRAYLVLTEDHRPPEVGPGWFVEPARLAERFELDQRGGRTARLLRVLGTRATDLGPLQECEFQIDRS